MTASPVPRVWLLIDDRPGHRTQVEGLARMMGWSAEDRILSFNFLNYIPNPILGRSLLSLRGISADSLRPPFPDVVVGMGRRVIPVARWIKRQSGGRSRIVMLGRKAGGASRNSDLYVSCSHFGSFPGPRLFELAVPPTKVDAESLAAARNARPDPLDGLRHPRVLLLVGGPTAQHEFTAGFAWRMANLVVRSVESLGGDLAIVTSRRTPADAIAAMREAAPAAHFHEWERARVDNPYLCYLAAADALVVTGESESMLAEGAATGLPLTIFPLQPKPPGLKARLIVAIHRMALDRGLRADVCRYLFDRGWLAPPRDLDRLHRAMVDHGLARLFESGVSLDTPDRNPDLDRLKQRIGELLDQAS